MDYSEYEVMLNGDKELDLIICHRLYIGEKIYDDSKMYVIYDIIYNHSSNILSYLVKEEYK